MEQWQQDNRRDVVMVDIDQLVPKDHLLRKIEKVMDYDWLYERLSPYYCHGVGRDGTDPVVLIKMVLIQHLFGIPSLRQTYREIQLNVAYRWFLGYSLLDRIPHFATVSYAFCKRFPSELPTEIFEHILNKAINNRAVDPSAVFIDGTHIKASANKKKFQKEQVAKTAKIYEEQLRKEVNAERAELGKSSIDDDDDAPKGGGTAEKTVSTTDPDCGMFVKGEHTITQKRLQLNLPTELRSPAGPRGRRKRTHAVGVHPFLRLSSVVELNAPLSGKSKAPCFGV